MLTNTLKLFSLKKQKVILHISAKLFFRKNYQNTSSAQVGKTDLSERHNFITPLWIVWLLTKFTNNYQNDYV
jgi:hypothetical protein